MRCVRRAPMRRAFWQRRWSSAPKRSRGSEAAGVPQQVLRYSVRHTRGHSRGGRHRRRLRRTGIWVYGFGANQHRCAETPLNLRIGHEQTTWRCLHELWQRCRWPIPVLDTVDVHQTIAQPLLEQTPDLIQIPVIVTCAAFLVDPVPCLVWSLCACAKDDELNICRSSRTDGPGFETMGAPARSWQTRSPTVQMRCGGNWWVCQLTSLKT